MKIIFYITVLFLSTSLLGQELTWNVIGEMRYPVAAGCTMSYGNIIYIVGGYSKDEQSAVDWIQKYDFSQGISKIVSSSSFPRTGLSGTGKGSDYYFFGGVHDTSQNGIYLEKWNYSSGYTGEIIDSNSTFNRINSAAEIVDNSLYIIGGNPYFANDTLSLNYIVEYNLLTGEITEHSTIFSGAEDLPEQQLTGVIGTNIFIFGGLLNGISRDIYRFDTVAKELSKLPSRLYEPRAGGAAVQYFEDDQIMLIGGFNESNSAMASTEIFRYTESSFSLKHGADLQKARAHNMAEFAGGEIYVMGGYGPNGEHIKEIERLDTAITGLEDSDLPKEFYLGQNYPNPFNPATQIEFKLDKSGSVKLDVYDVTGRLVSTLLDESMNAGKHIINFSADNLELSTGVYIYRLMTDNYTSSRKMLLLK